MRIECGARTDQGRVRTSNEDSFVANLGKRIFLVADGMGGHAAGEIASRMTAEKIEEVLSAGSTAPGATEDLLRFAVEQANASVHETQKLPGISGERFDKPPLRLGIKGIECKR